jgi:hypothetical protein
MISCCCSLFADCGSADFAILDIMPIPPLITGLSHSISTINPVSVIGELGLPRRFPTRNSAQDFSTRAFAIHFRHSFAHVHVFSWPILVTDLSDSVLHALMHPTLLADHVPESQAAVLLKLNGENR